MDALSSLAATQTGNVEAMTLLEECETKLHEAGYFDKDGPYSGMIGPHAMELIAVFDKQNHSGNSASIMAELLWRLINGKPLVGDIR